MVYEALPVGFIFDPSDLEMITYYLEKMAAGEDLPCRFIHRLDVYKSEPWNLLPADEFKLGVSRSEAFFFTPRHPTSSSSSSSSSKKSSGSRHHTRRTVRGGSGGFWHGNGHKKLIRRRGGDVVGHKTPLQFRTSEGIPTDWLMQEYLLGRGGGPCFESVALCKIYKKPNSSQRDDELEVEEWQRPCKKRRHQEPGEWIDGSQPAEAVPIWSSSDDFNSCRVVPDVIDDGQSAGNAASRSPATTMTSKLGSVDCSQNDMFTLAELLGGEDSINTIQGSGDYFCVDDYLCLDACCD